MYFHFRFIHHIYPEQLNECINEKLLKLIQTYNVFIEKVWKIHKHVAHFYDNDFYVPCIPS